MNDAYLLHQMFIFNLKRQTSGGWAVQNYVAWLINSELRHFVITEITSKHAIFSFPGIEWDTLP